MDPHDHRATIAAAEHGLEPLEQGSEEQNRRNSLGFVAEAEHGSAAVAEEGEHHCRPTWRGEDHRATPASDALGLRQRAVPLTHTSAMAIGALQQSTHCVQRRHQAGAPEHVGDTNPIATETLAKKIKGAIGERGVDESNAVEVKQRREGVI